jgi:methyltransferase
VVTAYTVLLLAVAAERLAELVISQRHLRWARERGALESGQGHYPVMVVVHIALLVGCLVEVHALDRPFVDWLGWPMLAVVVVAQTLRWWCIATLGSQWNTRVVVVPGLSLVDRGPYRWLRHPNYVAVVAEGVALPLVHDAWLTAVVFTAVNGVVLSVRIRCENRLLAVAAPASAAAGRPAGDRAASER